MKCWSWSYLASQTHLGIPGAMLSHSDKNSQLVLRKYLPAVTMGEKPSISPPAASPRPRARLLSLAAADSQAPLFPSSPQTVSVYLRTGKVTSPVCINQLSLFPGDVLSWLALMPALEAPRAAGPACRWTSAGGHTALHFYTGNFRRNRSWREKGTELYLFISMLIPVSSGFSDGRSCISCTSVMDQPSVLVIF